VLGQGGLLKQLTGRVLQKALEAELTEHVGYEKDATAGDNRGDSRKGYTEKRVFTENQETVIQVPRDQNGTFEPQIVPKYQKRVPLFNDQILSMYSFGMTNRDIQSHLEQVYHVEVSPELISPVTDAVLEDLWEWQGIGNVLGHRVSGRASGEPPTGRKKLPQERIGGPWGQW
jgi:transposase-like protein